MIERVLEPELMDDPSEAQAYDEMDHSDANERFVQDLLAAGGVGDEVLDLGTGNGRIPIELCRQYEDCRVLAVDAAVSMLEIAKVNIAIEGFEHRILLHHCDAKQMDFEDAMFDSVISNSLLHHLPEPQTALQEMIRVARPDARLFVRDLMRPASVEEIESLVDTYASQENAEAQQLFRQSLAAALTLDEMRELVVASGFDAETVCDTSDRHWTWSAQKPE